MKFRNLAILLCILPALGGCLRFSLETLKEINLEGKEFLMVLAREYRDFSESEAKKHDWVDAEHFADKGIKAAYGLHIRPEDPAKWDIPENFLPTLLEARTTLLATVTAKARELSPEASARAYFLYDCWVEEQEENWQIEHIDSCRNTFFEVLDYLNTMSESMEEDAIISIETIEPEEEELLHSSVPDSSLVIPAKAGILIKEDPRVKPEEDNSKGSEDEVSGFSIKLTGYFQPDGAEITEDITSTLDEIIKVIGSNKDYTITLNGHADTSKGDEYNLELSRERAEAVRDALVAKGANPNSIDIFGFGDTDPAEEIKDGESNSSNHRVEIIIE